MLGHVHVDTEEHTDLTLRQWNEIPQAMHLDNQAGWVTREEDE